MSALAEAAAPPPADGGRSPQEAAWWFAEAEAIAVMGTVNVAIARLVAAVRDLLVTDGWEGIGIQSPEPCWKAGVSRARAEGLVAIARRARDLPACWALFAAGRLGEDAMVRIARRVTAARDAEIAALAPTLLVSQLDRLLRSLPDQPDGTEPQPEPERMLRLRDGRDGWLRGQFCLPADEGALVRLGLTSARDAELRDRNDLPQPDPDPVEAAGARSVSWADGLVGMASEAADALDPTYRRTGHRGERNTVVVHIDVAPDGTLGPAHWRWARSCPTRGPVPVLRRPRPGHGLPARPAHRHPPHPTHPQPRHAPLPRPPRPRLHPPPVPPAAVAARPPHHPLGTRGPTVPPNLVLLCPSHHRALHLGEFSIVGNPENGTLRFLDRWGQPISPPDPAPPNPGPPRGGGPPPEGQPPSRYTPPLAERLTADTFTWN
jgi:Domain of unknown function (DUF222)